MELTKQQARRGLLAYHGLWPAHQLAGKSGILTYIHQVGCIQFDPLDIVGHNSDLVLQSRVGDYRRDMLRQLLYADRRLIDGFDKMMAIYPVEDWPYFRRWRDSFLDGNHRSAGSVQEVLPQVREAIETRGPVSSQELGMHEIVDWDWSQSRLGRAALESMYFWGELVIHHRVHTRKYYDFARRHLPQELLDAPDPNQTEEEYQDWYVLRRLGNMGLAWNRSGEGWLGMNGIKSQLRNEVMKRLVQQGRVIQAAIDGTKDPFFFRADDLPSFTRGMQMDEPQPQAVIIAPLDNIMWDRRQLLQLFNFDYRWEVYVPEAKRRYGYYVLPVLYGDRFIARFEPGKGKKNEAFTIKNWWWEEDVPPDPQMIADLAVSLKRFANYLGVERIHLERQPLEQAGLGELEILLVEGS
jgi:uncharacterized protein YcaQ